jgi:hypothetical protein
MTGSSLMNVIEEISIQLIMIKLLTAVEIILTLALVNRIYYDKRLKRLVFISFVVS